MKPLNQNKMEQTTVKKETSIEWLMTQLYKKGFIKEVDGSEPINLMNQAKAMEKEQKEKFWTNEEVLRIIQECKSYLSFGDEFNEFEWFNKFKK